MQQPSSIMNRELMKKALFLADLSNEDHETQQVHVENQDDFYPAYNLFN